MLFLGLMLGLIYIYIVPPWQHYDEPTHFEYTWLIANHPGLPSNGESDQSMRREVAASMIEKGFFRDLDINTNLLSNNKPIWIGISQIGSVPLYYWLSAIPLRFLRAMDVTQQLYVVRFGSLILYLVTIIAAYGIAVELTPVRHPLRWLLPFSILMLPGFIDIMTAANDDVGAVAFFSLFLWTGIRLIIKGFNWSRLLLFLILGIVCFFTKNTVMIAIGLIAIPVAFSLIGGKKQRYVWVTFVAALILIGVGFLTRGDAAYWYRTQSPEGATRILNPDSPEGSYAISILSTNGKVQPKVEQLIPVPGDHLSEVTVGAWIWADIPIVVRTPILYNGDDYVFEEVKVSEEPQFFSFTTEIMSTIVPVKISLYPLRNKPEKSVTIYYDGVVLVPGIRPTDTLPEFSDSNGVTGKWGGQEFKNLIRNPSVETAGFSLRPWVDRALKGRFPGNLALIIGLLLDPEPIDFYYVATIKSLAQSFWAKFGWGNVVLKGYRPYTILGLVALLGVIGAGFSFWENHKDFPWVVAVFLGAATISIWLLALIRGLSSLVGENYFVPVARYAYPVIIPTMLVLNIGWLKIIRWFERYLSIPHQLMYILLIVFFLALNVVSLVTISRFFID
jgi:hypothetical protein